MIITSPTLDSSQTLYTRAEQAGSIPARQGSDAAIAAAPPATVLELIDRARDALLEACHSQDTVERHRLAQLGALRAAAAALASRSRSKKSPRRRDVWDSLGVLHPELAEWAQFFAMTAVRGTEAAQGRVHLNGREADDLLRQAEVFIESVMSRLGLPMMGPLPGCVPAFQRT